MKILNNNGYNIEFCGTTFIKLCQEVIVVVVIIIIIIIIIIISSLFNVDVS